MFTSVLKILAAHRQCSVASNCALVFSRCLLVRSARMLLTVLRQVFDELKCGMLVQWVSSLHLAMFISSVELVFCH